MCQFFSGIVTRDGRCLFTEDDSHETIIARVHLRDTSTHLRHWVRVELVPAAEGWAPLRVDETSTPAWWDEDRPRWEALVQETASVVAPAWAAYQAAVAPAEAAYLLRLRAIPGYVPEGA